MIKRDGFGIIVQHNLDYPEQADGGDSAARTGIMALSGSELDITLLPFFIIKEKLVRHPHQTKWNSSELTSRDQLVQWAAGNLHTNNVYLNKIIINYAKSWTINSDILPPDVKLYLYKCAHETPPQWLSLLGTINMIISLFWSCFIMSSNETNQIICMSVAFGPKYLKFLYTHHPDLEKNISEYYEGAVWRNQPEISKALLSYINRRVCEVL